MPTQALPFQHGSLTLLYIQLLLKLHSFFKWRTENWVLCKSCGRRSFHWVRMDHELEGKGVQGLKLPCMWTGKILILLGYLRTLRSSRKPSGSFWGIDGTFPLRMWCHMAPLWGSGPAPAARAIVSDRAKMSAFGKWQYCCREKMKCYTKKISCYTQKCWDISSKSSS